MRVLFLVLSILWLRPALGQGGIVVRGYWKNADDKKLTLEFLSDAVIFKSTTLTSEVDSLTGYFHFSVPSDRPTKLQLLNHFLLAIPNDTIFVSIDKNEKGTTLNFTNAVEKEESFFFLFQKSIKRFAINAFPFEKISSIDEYKKETTAHYHAAVDFLNTHSSHYSSYGKALIKELISIDYYSDLIYPINSRKVLKEQLPTDYFAGVDISLFNKPDLLGFREYILLLSSYNECFYCTRSPNGKFFDPSHVANRITSAKTNFVGETRDNLMLLIYESLISNGTKENADQVKELFKLVSVAFKDNSARLQQIDEMKRQFGILGKPLPSSILLQKVRSAQGKTVLLSEALPDQKIIYIDFWASWCGPCIAEMPQEQKLISEFEKDNNDVEFVFISLDKANDSWQKAMKKINIGTHHYQLPDAFNSVLVKYLGFETIPRYIVIDKKGSLLSRDAPRPGIILKDKSKLYSLIK